jgi:hypothetical protein
MNFSDRNAFDAVERDWVLDPVVELRRLVNGNLLGLLEVRLASTWAVIARNVRSQPALRGQRRLLSSLPYRERLPSQAALEFASRLAGVFREPVRIGP